MSSSSNTTTEDISSPVYHLRLSNEKDLPFIDQIIKDGVEAIRVQGFDQWQDGYPNLDIIREDQTLNRSYVLEKDGEVVGIATIFLLGEPAYLTIYDGQWTADQPYGCLHRVAISKKVYGKGAAQKLIEVCEEEVKRQGINYMRIDTHEDNLPMLSLLQKKCQYKVVGKVDFIELGATPFMRVALDKLL